MLNLSKTSFNKKAIAEMSFSKFEKAYRGKFSSEVDLKKLFVDNGGKLK